MRYERYNTDSGAQTSFPTFLIVGGYEFYRIVWYLLLWSGPINKSERNFHLDAWSTFTFPKHEVFD